MEPLTKRMVDRAVRVLDVMDSMAIANRGTEDRARMRSLLLRLAETTLSNETPKSRGLYEAGKVLDIGWQYAFAWADIRKRNDPGPVALVEALEELRAAIRRARVARVLEGKAP